MAISKRFRYKDKEGKVTDYEYGVNGSNVTQDANHRLVTDKEKETWNGKANPEDIPSGSAASYGVANNDTTNRSDMLATAQVAYQHGKEIDQLNSETDRINVYVGSDGKLHFVNKAGADSVLPFSPVKPISFTIMGIVNEGNPNYWYTYSDNIDVSEFDTLTFSNFVGADAHNSSGTLFVFADGATVVDNSASIPGPINITNYSKIKIQLQARYAKKIAIDVTLS